MLDFFLLEIRTMIPNSEMRKLKIISGSPLTEGILSRPPGPRDKPVRMTPASLEADVTSPLPTAAVRHGIITWLQNTDADERMRPVKASPIGTF
jgi:hypothetical protein